MPKDPQPLNHPTQPTEDRRSEIRIQEATDKEVRAELIVESHQRWKNLTISNLSQHGVSLEIPSLRAHLIHPQQKVTLKLRLGKEGAELEGTVVHCDPPQVGITFLEPEAKEWSYSDSILSRMIFTLERKHLRRKAYQKTL